MPAFPAALLASSLSQLILLIDKNNEVGPWPVLLSGLNLGPCTKGSQVQFRVKGT